MHSVVASGMLTASFGLVALALALLARSYSASVMTIGLVGLFALSTAATWGMQTSRAMVKTGPELPIIRQGSPSESPSVNNYRLLADRGEVDPNIFLRAPRRLALVIKIVSARESDAEHFSISDASSRAVLAGAFNMVHQTGFYLQSTSNVEQFVAVFNYVRQSIVVAAQLGQLSGDDDKKN